MTYNLISTVTVGATSVSTIDFTSIPQTYTDLVLVLSARASTATVSTPFYLTVNSLTTNRSWNAITTTGAGNSNAGTTDTQQGTINGLASTTSAFGNAMFYIPKYSSVENKAWIVESINETNATAISSYVAQQHLTDTTAISSLSLTFSTNTVVQYTSASLYGIN